MCQINKANWRNFAFIEVGQFFTKNVPDLKFYFVIMFSSDMLHQADFGEELQAL